MQLTIQQLDDLNAIQKKINTLASYTEEDFAYMSMIPIEREATEENGETFTYNSIAECRLQVKNKIRQLQRQALQIIPPPQWIECVTWMSR